jgi:hypothetical protein
MDGRLTRIILFRPVEVGGILPIALLCDHVEDESFGLNLHELYTAQLERTR